MGLLKEGEEAEVETGERAGGSRTPLIVTLVVVLLVGALYYSYYRKQAVYFTGRNLRLLSMLTAQVEGQLLTAESLDDALRPVLARRVRAAFDVLIVADASGK